MPFHNSITWHSGVTLQIPVLFQRKHSKEGFKGNIKKTQEKCKLNDTINAFSKFNSIIYQVTFQMLTFHVFIVCRMFFCMVNMQLYYTVVFLLC